MADNAFVFDAKQFNKLFPFYLLLDKELQIIAAGNSLLKLYPDAASQYFLAAFEITPTISINSFADFALLNNQLILMEAKTPSAKIILQGQFEFLAERSQYLFIGSPLLQHAADMQQLHLSTIDFAIHDAGPALLQLLNQKEKVSEDLKELLKILYYKKEQQHLEQQEVKRLSLVASLNKNSVLFLNETGAIVWSNEGFSNFTGYSMDEVKNKDFIELGMGPLSAENDVTDILRRLKTGETIEAEFIYYKKNGEACWCKGKGQPIPSSADGEQRFFLILDDITAEKHAQNALMVKEEKYRSIIANMNLGLLEVDLDEVIQFANNSFCKMSGYTIEELIGKSASALFIKDDTAGGGLKDKRSRIAGISDAYEIKTITKKGDTKWWLISGAPRYNEAGATVGSIGIHLDITEQKQMEVQLKAAKEVAENAQAAEQEFLANMSHEIRTPLNAIAGMTYLLQDTAVDKEQQEYLDVVQSSTEILLRLVTNILDISKIEAGKIEATIKEIDIVHLLKGLEKTIRIQHKNSDVKIVFGYPKSPVHYVESDDLMITQILLNLLSNASKFTSVGEIKLQADLYSNQEDEVLLNVLITDTGKGMSQKEQHSIFEKFIQAGDEESRAKGSGLGLAITKKLVEFLKGTIHLESREGVGSKFTITIPMKIGRSSAAEHASDTVEDQVFNLKGFKVLVAEDNEVNRKYIGKLLSKWGLHFKFAVNGQEAIDMLQMADSFDIVLMDLQMPIKDGIEATIEIRTADKWYKNIPIIGVSATAITGLKQKARESGINDFVSKPYTPIQLQTAMGRFLKAAVDTSSAEPIPAVPEDTFVFSEHLNTTHLHEMIDGDFEYAKVLFEIFENTIVPQVEDVKKLFQQNDCTAFSKLIHKIKPTFPMVGIPGFDDLLHYLETASSKVNDLSQLESTYQDFLHRVAIYIPIISHEKQRLEKYLAAYPQV